MTRSWAEHGLVISHPPVCRGYFSCFGGAFCIENYNISRSGYLPKFDQMLRLPRKVTLQQYAPATKSGTYWAVTLLSCHFTELLLYWAVTLLSCYFTELLLYGAVTSAFLNLRNSEVSHLNVLWKLYIYIYIYMCLVAWMRNSADVEAQCAGVLGRFSVTGRQTCAARISGSLVDQSPLAPRAA